MQAEARVSGSLRLRAAAVMLVLLAALGMAGINVIAQDTDAPQGFDLTTTTQDVNVLRAEAVRSGSIRVIVGVKTKFDGVNAPNDANFDAAFAFEAANAQNSVLATVAVASANVEVSHQYDFIPFMALTVDAAALDALAAHPMVTSIESDSLSYTTMSSTLPIIGASGAGGAWDLGFTGKGFTVAVLDTGVDKVHPALAGAVVSEACYNTKNSTYQSTSRCPGNKAASTAAGSGVDCLSAVAAGCEHGTHVAGTVASRDGSFTGVAPEAKLIAINVFAKFPHPSSDPFGSCSPYGTACVLSWTSDQVAGMNRVYALRNQYKIAALNMSLGGGNYATQSSCDAANTTRKAAINKLRNVNIASVISSGNSALTSSMGAPGCITGAISVGATDDADNVASFSNSASFLSLLAPGVSVTSADAGSAGFKTLNGTSMAAPHVAGAWAVMRQGKPGASVSTVFNALKSTGEPVTDTRGGAGNRVKPRIQLNEALLKLAKPAKPTNITAPPINDTIIAVKWKDVATETGYSIERSLNGTTGWTQVGTRGKNATAFTNSGLNCNTTYFFRVLAWNQGVPSAPSDVVSKKPKDCISGTELLVNGSFETNVAAPVNVPDSWNKGGTLKGDKVIADAAKAHGGTNSFQFTGYAGETGSLISQDVPSGDVDGGDFLVLSLYLDQKNAKTNITIGKLIIKYNDGTATKQIPLKTPVVKSVGYVRVFTKPFEIQEDNVAKVTVQLLHNGPTGKFYVDDASVLIALLVPLSAENLDLRGQ